MSSKIIFGRKVEMRESGLVVPVSPPEPPKERHYHTALIRRHDDVLTALRGLYVAGAELVSVARGGKGGGILLDGPGYVIMYLHDKALSFEEKC